MTSNIGTPLCEDNPRKGHNVLSSAVSRHLDSFLRNLDLEDGVSADYVAEYVLGISGAAVSQYRSQDQVRNIPLWAVLKLTKHFERIDLLRACLASIGVEVAWRHEVKASPSADIDTILALLEGENGKLLTAYIQTKSPDSDGGTNISAKEKRDILAPLIHKLRRFADDLDDRITEETEASTSRKQVS